jgi:hypothetical protein
MVKLLRVAFGGANVEKSRESRKSESPEVGK